MKKFFYTVGVIITISLTTNTFVLAQDKDIHKGWGFLKSKFRENPLSELEFKKALIGLINQDQAIMFYYFNLTKRGFEVKKQDIKYTLFMLTGLQTKEMAIANSMDPRTDPVAIGIIESSIVQQVTASTFYANHKSQYEDVATANLVGFKPTRNGNVDYVLTYPGSASDYTISLLCGNPTYPDDQSAYTEPPIVKPLTPTPSPYTKVAERGNGDVYLSVTVNANPVINNSNNVEFREVAAAPQYAAAPPPAQYGLAPMQYAAPVGYDNGGYTEVVNRYRPNVLDYINTGLNIYSVFAGARTGGNQGGGRGYNNTPIYNNPPQGGYTGNHQASTAFAPGTTTGPPPSSQTGTGRNILR